MNENQDWLLPPWATEDQIRAAAQDLLAGATGLLAWRASQTATAVVMLAAEADALCKHAAEGW